MVVATAPRRWDRLALVLLLALWGSLAGLALLAASAPLARAFDRIQYELYASGRQMFLNRGTFLEFEDRLLLEEIPRTRHEDGGVYFFGSSNLKWGLALWRLPEATRAHVHNYGVGATGHTQQGALVRYLFEARGLDRAPPERTHLVLAVSTLSGAFHDQSPYFPALLARYGLYTYDRDRGMAAVDFPAPLRALRFEHARVTSFVAFLANQAARLAFAALGLRAEGAADRTPEGIARGAAPFEVADPDAMLDRELGALAATLDYVRAHGKGLTLVLLPERSAIRATSLARTYRARVTALAAAHGVPFVDLNELLAEDEYFDLNHADAHGLVRVHEALMAAVPEALR